MRGAELWPLSAGPPVSADALLDELLAGDGGGVEGWPRVVAIMIASADGRAAVGGRSVALGHPADRALLRGLRARADAVLVGTGTLAAERYANLIDDHDAARRRSAGRPAHPLIVTSSRTLDLPEIPLLGEPDVPVLVITAAGENTQPPRARAALEVAHVGEAGLEPRAMIELLAGRGTRLVVCEGGPTMLARLAAAGMIDDLLLTLAPLLAAGDGPALLSGPELDPPRELALRGAHRADDHLFLHYVRRDG